MEKERGMYLKFLEVSKETGLPVKKVLDVFFVLSTGEPIDNNELLRKVGVSRNVLNQVKKSLSQFLAPVSQNTQIKPDRLEEMRGLYEPGYGIEEQMWGFLEDEHFINNVNLLRELQGRRPIPKREFDQFSATIETTARRASLLNFFGDIRGKRLLFLGDDDFTSIASANYGQVDRIVVLDIDKRILNAIGLAATEQNVEVETKEYDARRKPPNNLVGQFDIVFTDPPYTPEGIKLFVSRSTEFLDIQNKAARIYTCYGNSDRAKERYLPVHEALTESGLMTRWVFDKFNRYHGAESIGSSSSLLITEVTPKTKPVIEGDYDKPIYTNN